MPKQVRHDGFGSKAGIAFGIAIRTALEKRMIWNIVDRRERVYRWKTVNAVVETVEHDNSCVDADQAAEADLSSVVDYDQLEGISVQQAIQWANQQTCPVTLYLYDEGKGTTSEEHFDEVANRF